jgi:hypothetical protein
MAVVMVLFIGTADDDDDDESVEERKQKLRIKKAENQSVQKS